MADESEEIKTLGQHQLACIAWPTRMSPTKDNSSYLTEFAEHIRRKFNEPSLNKYNREINEFSSLRNIAMSVSRNDCPRDASSLKALKKYYCQLNFMQNRFKDSEAVFSWSDSFGRSSHEGNLEFEINNIMYNIAAIHNEFGSRIEKTSEQSTKEACVHFNNALWWVTELRDNRAGFKSKELGHDLLTFFHHIVKAQSQECIFLHSIRTSMKPDNVAKITAQIASDYEVASKLAVSSIYTDFVRDLIGGASILYTWRATVDFKHKYFSTVTYLLLGITNRDDNAREIGIRIARLRQAAHYVELCKKILNDVLGTSVAKAAFASLESLVSRKLDKAIRYNDNVYHSVIPAGETLPKPDPKLLASGIPFTASSISDFKDLFGGLVTIESVQVSSIYSQRKDDLSRQISQQVEKQDEDLAQMMSTLNIEKNSLDLKPLEVPDDLIELCAELSMNPLVVDDVLTQLEELDDQSDNIQQMLDRVEELLRKRPNRIFQDELNRFKKTHGDAKASTSSLHSKLYPELKRKIQQMATTENPLELLPKFDSPESDHIVRDIKRLLDQVDSLKRERADLLFRLKQSLNEDDDVIKHVVTASSEQELKSIFDSEIQKHNKYLEPLQSNLKKQDVLLDSIERLNADYGQVRLNRRTHQKAHTEMVESLKKYYSQFKTVKDGIEEGLEYHKKMVQLVENFYKKVQTSVDLNDLLN